MAWLALVHPPGQPSVAFERMVEALDQAGWRLDLRAYGLAVLTRGRAERVHPLSGTQGVGGVLIGEAFDRAATDRGETAHARLDGLADLDPLDVCQALITGAWGGYVAVLAPRRALPPTVLRDPTGQVEALIWRRDEVTLVGSEIPYGLAAPLDLAIDWKRLAEILAEPARGAGTPPLTGVVAADPGTFHQGWGGKDRTVLWSPADIIRRAPRRDWPSREALRGRVDASIAALAQDAQRILCEISGGLDSAIVATSLAAIGRPADHAIHFYRGQAEADERAYARAAADRASVALETVFREPYALDAATLEASARFARPNFNALDPDYDAGLCTAIEQSRADVLFTGHGGDVAFLQVGAAALGAELLAGQPCEGSRWTRLAEVARRNRRSVWSLGWEAIRGSAGRLAPERAVEKPRLLTVASQRPPHPWVADLRGVPAAKRAQVHGLTMSLTLMGPTRRAERARLAHPLLSQPVVELCLSIPAPVLSAGETERSYARGAFAERLPASIVERRSKGEISVFFGRSLAASLGFLRPFLLDGRLVAEGLLDGEALDTALTPQSMVWKDATIDILAAATLEAWVRHWEGRIAGAAEPEMGGGPRVSARKARARP